MKEKFKLVGYLNIIRALASTELEPLLASKESILLLKVSH